jgi:acyl dehydratase
MNISSSEIKDVEPGPVVEMFLEDIEIGRVREAGPITVTADEIISFAERYDPLPMHVSDEGGQATVHDSLIASGVLTIALKQRMIMSVERNAAIIGAAKIEEQNFLKPVRAGDELFMRQECVAKRESRTRFDRGLVIWEFVLTNQRKEAVFSSRDIVMVRRRPD